MKEYIREYESVFSDCKVNKIYMPILHTESIYFESSNFEDSKSSKMLIKNSNDRFKSSSLNRFSNYEGKKNEKKINEQGNKVSQNIESENMVGPPNSRKSIVIDLNSDVYFTESNSG